MKNLLRNANKKKLSLGDLVNVVCSSSRNNSEALATLIGLFESRRVVTWRSGQMKRIRISMDL